jgi:hypothetical protein
MNSFFSKKISIKKFNLIILISVIFICITPLIVKKIFFEKFFINNMNKDIYYNSLYGTSNIGCSTLNYIKPDILFIGNSISYRAWDMNLIQKNINLSIGTCFLPGFTQNSFQELVNFVEKKFTPKFIVLSNNYRIFGLGTGDFKMTNRHKKLLNEIDQSEYQQAFKLFSRKLRGKNFYKVSLPINEEIQNYINITNDEIFDKFTNIIVNQNLKASGIGNFKDAEIAFTDDLQLIKEYKHMNFFCNYLKKNNINLILTNTPYSPPLEKINMSKNLKNNLIVKNYFKECLSNKFIYKNNDNFVSKNKYFVFTNFKNIDQNVFQNVISNGITDENLISYYDFDHMNRYGAKKFTDYWIKTSKNIFKNENK